MSETLSNLSHEERRFPPSEEFSARAVATQDLYNQLFPVVQAVITDKDADIDALLATANKAGQKAIDAAS